MAERWTADSVPLEAYDRMRAERDRLRKAIRVHRQAVADATAAGQYDATGADEELWDVLSPGEGKAG